MALAASTVLAAAAGAQPVAPAPPPRPRKLAIANKVWTGDFDKLLERRMLRVAAPFSRSLYFNDRGRERGLAVELVRDWERYVNVKYARQLGQRPLTIYVVPATRDKLLPDVAAGLADVAIGNLTITEERQESVDFVTGNQGRHTLDEVVVTGRSRLFWRPSTTSRAGASTYAGRRATTRAWRSSTSGSAATAGTPSCWSPCPTRWRTKT